MPKSSNNSAWVRLGTVQERSSFAIRYEDRFQRLNLEERPSLALFLGNKNKNAALRQVFPKNNAQRRAEDYSTLNLHLDNVTKLTDAPVVFADGDPLPREVGEHVLSNQEASFVIPLPWATEYGNAVWAAFLALSVLPHVDVVCVFTEDCGGLDGTQNLLEMWADMAPTSQYHSLVRPHLMLVNSDATINRRNIPPALLQPFSECSVVMLASSGRSSATRHASLKANFEEAIVSTRTRRATASMLFSAKHLNALILQSMKQANQPAAVPFNVLEASRLNNRVSLDYGVHLTNFMVLAKHHRIPHEAVRSFVASAILMDAYPPGMHSRSESFRSSAAHTDILSLRTESYFLYAVSQLLFVHLPQGFRGYRLCGILLSGNREPSHIFGSTSDGRFRNHCAGQTCRKFVLETILDISQEQYDVLVVFVMQA
jgi:hypothetical protein